MSNGEETAVIDVVPLTESEPESSAAEPEPRKSGPKKKGAGPKARQVVTTKSGKTFKVPKADPAPVMPVKVISPVFGNVRKTPIKIPKVAGAKKPLVESLGRTATMIKMVADPTRAAVVLLILENERLNVNEMCHVLNVMSQPALSHHLAILRHAGICVPEREGKSNYYVLSERGLMLARVLQGLIT